MLSRTIHRLSGVHITPRSANTNSYTNTAAHFSTTNNDPDANKPLIKPTTAHVKPTATSTVKPITTTRLTSINVLKSFDATSNAARKLDAKHNSAPLHPTVVTNGLNRFSDKNTDMDSSTLFTPLQASKLVTHNYQQIASLFYGVKPNINSSIASMATPPISSHAQHHHTSTQSSHSHHSAYEHTHSYTDSGRNGDGSQADRSYDIEQFYKQSLRHALGGTRSTADLPVGMLQKQSVADYESAQNRYRFRPISTQQRKVPVQAELRHELNAQGIAVVLETDTTPDASQSLVKTSSSSSTEHESALSLDSVKRKRKLKMKNHKRKKRRREERMAKRKNTAQ